MFISVTIYVSTHTYDAKTDNLLHITNTQHPINDKTDIHTLH